MSITNHVSTTDLRHSAAASWRWPPSTAVATCACLGHVLEATRLRVATSTCWVDVDPGRSLLDLVELSDELTALLGCRVDLLTERGLSPYLRDQICAEAIPL